MAKIQFVTERKYMKNGESKTIYDCMLTMSTGEDRGAVSFDEVKKGDEIDDSRVESDSRGGWRIKSAGKPGGKQWPRNDELQIAQTVFRALVDLHIQGRIQMFDTDSDRYFQPNMTNLGTEMGRTIQNISRNLKGGQQPCASTAQQPAATPPDDFDAEFPKFAPLKSIGELCARGVDVYGKTMTLAKIVSILQAAKLLRTADIKDIKNLDEAWETIRANEESKKC
jgi:hypothetical protein